MTYLAAGCLLFAAAMAVAAAVLAPIPAWAHALAWTAIGTVGAVGFYSLAVTAAANRPPEPVDLRDELRRRG